MIVDYCHSNINKLENSVDNKNPTQDHINKLIAIENALNNYIKIDAVNINNIKIKPMNKTDEIKMRQNEEQAFKFLSKFCEVEKEIIYEHDGEWEENISQNDNDIYMDEHEICDDIKLTNISKIIKLKEKDFSNYEEENLMLQNNYNNYNDNKNTDQTSKFKKMLKNTKKRQVNIE